MWLAKQAMPYLYNLHRQKNLRRHLRATSSKPERVLWELLRRRQLGGYKFRRQHGIRRFIVDFYCPQIKLAIEIDGEIHAIHEQAKRDTQRQAYLEKLGISFLRFTDDIVLNDPEEVASMILFQCWLLDRST